MSMLTLARLLRIPNVFTAFADIALGILIALSMAPSASDPSFTVRAFLLLAAGGCLYCAGMVLNDWFDVETDRRERGFRPLPSGKISAGFALRLGLTLLAVGFGCALGSDTVGERANYPATKLAVLLISSIVLYNGVLKSSDYGPIAMGACRFFNVLMGLTLCDAMLPTVMRVHLAAAVGTYIMGVTLLAKNEVTDTLAEKPGEGAKRAVVPMLLSFLLALAVPARLPEASTTPLYPYLLIVLAILIGSALAKAVTLPTAEVTQSAVRTCIFGLVGLDAVLATAFYGPAGLLILLLLVPAILLGRKVYST